MQVKIFVTRSASLHEINDREDDIPEPFHTTHLLSFQG